MIIRDTSMGEERHWIYFDGLLFAHAISATQKDPAQSVIDLSDTPFEFDENQ